MAMPASFDKLKSLLKSLPQTTGIYKMKDEEGNIIYIGKANNLRSRVAQHFQEGRKVARSAVWSEERLSSAKPIGTKDAEPVKSSEILSGAASASPLRGQTAKAKKMMEKIADIDVIETETEFEALVLETNLIKEFRPRYNVLMRDDKNYVYIKVSTNEDYPRLSIVRKREHDGAIYFGPKTSADACEKLISLLRKIFPIRTCGLEMHDNHDGEIVITKKTCPIPCLDFHIKRCRAPCINLIKKEEYAELIKQIVRFLRGAYQDLVTRLKYQMFNAARDKKFETAAKIRDQIKGIEAIFMKQHVSDPEFIDRDVIGVFPDFDKTFINLFQFREGKLINQENFAFDTPQGLSTSSDSDNSGSVIESFLRSYYSEASDIPPEIFLRERPEDAQLWEQWLTELRHDKIKFITPLIGKKNKILELSEKNAASFGKQSRAKWMSDTAKTTQACEDLAQELGIDRVLQRIECYDISHLGGEDTTASMVVFIKGSPQPKLYRHFKLKTLETGEVDDYKALEEVLTRRLQRLSAFSSADLAQYTFKKPLKKDIETIEKIGKGVPPLPLDGSVGMTVGAYFNKESEDQLVGYCRILSFNEGKTLAISKIFIEGKHDTRALRHQLFRHITDKCALPHIYAICDKDRKEDFLSFGFTELKKVPEVLVKNMEAGKLLFEELRPGATPARRQARRSETCRASMAGGASRKAVSLLPIYLIFKISKTSPDESFNASPDLIIVDGGKGQLSSAMKALQSSGLDIPIIGLAKQEEEIFMPCEEPAKVFSKSFVRRHACPPAGAAQRDTSSEHGGRCLEKMLLSARSLLLPRNSQALYLVQRIRDESHRFANELRKKIGSKKLTESDIDGIPGIGQILKRRLLKEYGSINGIKKAPMEALERTVGTGVAKMLKERLGKS